MTVKELIKKLGTLEQDKNIWVFYDQCYLIEPEIDVVKPDDNVSENQGDYYFMAW